MKMQDVIALITGGASGLGAGTAARFIEAGARVVILDRDADKGARAWRRTWASARASPPAMSAARRMCRRRWNMCAPNSAG